MVVVVAVVQGACPSSGSVPKRPRPKRARAQARFYLAGCPQNLALSLAPKPTARHCPGLGPMVWSGLVWVTPIHPTPGTSTAPSTQPPGSAAAGGRSFPQRRAPEGQHSLPLSCAHTSEWASVQRRNRGLVPIACYWALKLLHCTP